MRLNLKSSEQTFRTRPNAAAVFVGSGADARLQPRIQRSPRASVVPYPPQLTHKTVIPNPHRVRDLLFRPGKSPADVARTRVAFASVPEPGLLKSAVFATFRQRHCGK